MGIKEALLNEKTTDTIVLLKDRELDYPKKLSEETDTTYSYMVRMLSELEDENLVASKEEGRKKGYHLTDKGERIGEKLQELYEEASMTARNRESQTSGSRPSISDSIGEEYD